MSPYYGSVIQSDMIGGAAAFHRAFRRYHALQREAASWDRSGPNAFAVDISPRMHGNSLPDSLRQSMEHSLGADFTDVRVHVGQEAQSIGALAFTWGSNIYFSPGQYNPDTLQGRMLIGHELTHVVQQRSGRVRNPFGSGVAVVQDQALEAEADRLGTLVAMAL